jgi:hypothetical protein
MTKPGTSKTKLQYRLGDYCVCPDTGAGPTGAERYSPTIVLPLLTDIRRGRGYWGRTVFFHSHPAIANGVKLLNETDDSTFDEAMDYTGTASVSDAVLWLSSTKAYTGRSFATPAEYARFLASLPPWPLTVAPWAWKEGTLLDCRTGVAADLNDPEAKFAWQRIMAIRYSPELKAATQRHMKESTELLRQMDEASPSRAIVEKVIAEDAAELAEWDRQEKLGPQAQESLRAALKSA